MKFDRELSDFVRKLKFFFGAEFVAKSEAKTKCRASKEVLD